MTDDDTIHSYEVAPKNKQDQKFYFKSKQASNQLKVILSLCLSQYLIAAHWGIFSKKL